MLYLTLILIVNILYYLSSLNDIIYPSLAYVLSDILLGVHLIVI